jgi:hypothetical protein
MTPEPRDPTAGGPHPTQDELIDLVLGHLEPARASAIRAHVEACAACEQDWREAMADRERARARRVPAAGRTLLRPSSSPRRPWIARRLVTAVAVAAGLAAVFWLFPRAPVLEPVWLPSGVALESRGTASTMSDSMFWSGLEAYRRHDAAKAIEALERSVGSEPGLESLRRVHLASAWMMRGDARRALDALADLDIEELPHPWRGETRWVRACALARLGRSREAREELQRLAADPGDAAVRARRALGSPGR